MFEAMQETVDRLAAALGRAVTLQGHDFELISNSAHFGEVDPAQAILLAERRPSDEVLQSFRDLKVLSKHEAFIIVDAEPRSGLLIPRWMLPLRSESQLHGFLTVFISQDLDTQDLEVLAEASQTLLRLLEHSSRSIADVNAIAESEMLGLIADDRNVRELAAADLLGLGMFTRSRYFVAFHLDTQVDWVPWEAPAMRDFITRMLLRAITTPMIDGYGFIPTSPHSFILVGFQRVPSSEAIMTIARGIERELGVGVEGSQLDGVLGVGGIVRSLDLSWQSYEQAIVAASVARQQGRIVTSWDDEPVLSALAVLVPGIGAEHMLPRPLHLMQVLDPETVGLLEAFLDHAGRIPDVAQELGVHRSTVYQRLARAETHLGLDLADGRTRLMLHAWLELSQRGRD